eukprot:CAMPEP_0179172488 /NCGR_PEP_ID=MMETSP0796-20121207/85069_1 /TAXON_ID=73915 /ORGANISM="Pyrodinium bahamense, Strain pbaha01" /LENGTH=32 /DNA_ID= /DNA_START= /DNA_END= /DNA_ORIENTATION=
MTDGAGKTDTLIVLIAVILPTALWAAAPRPGQ